MVRDLNNYILKNLFFQVRAPFCYGNNDSFEIISSVITHVPHTILSILQRCTATYATTSKKEYVHTIDSQSRKVLHR